MMRTIPTIGDQLIAQPPRGLALLDDPILNKGTAFSLEERERYGLEGLLPPSVEGIDRQVERVMEHLGMKQSDLERYIYLTGLLDRNETLFYRVVMSDPARFIPILYDPTVAYACLAFGHIYRRARGMYITRAMKGRIAQVLAGWPEQDIRFICVSTGGRILGLGDIGANGMGIPIGKLQLYTACAAVPPNCLLPILLDIGTSNEELRADALYLGSREKPPSEWELDELVAEFVQAVQQVFPGCCIHFEDWKGTDAIRLLDRYADKVLCYNDDIQGTASVVLAGLTTALEIIDASLTEQRILFLGAGSAGIGIAKLVAAAMQTKGLSQQEARSRISMFDVDGLLDSSRSDLSEAQRIYAHAAEPSKDLRKAIETLKPTVLIGVSTRGGAFNKGVVEAMSELNERPIIFALSNPTNKAECTAEQAYNWSKGKALFAAGVQFPDVGLNGKTYHPGQANNFYIYPAVGLATYAARPLRLTDECFVVAAQAAADQVGPDLRARGMLFPGQANILEMEITTAARVAEFLFDKELAQVKRPCQYPRLVGRPTLYATVWTGRGVKEQRTWIAKIVPSSMMFRSASTLSATGPRLTRWAASTCRPIATGAPRHNAVSSISASGMTVCRSGSITPMAMSRKPRRSSTRTAGDWRNGKPTRLCMPPTKPSPASSMRAFRSTSGRPDQGLSQT
jgi:malate dehydrogenase (oxaloacetate-decarboxylating)(NADP+)